MRLPTFALHGAGARTLRPVLGALRGARWEIASQRRDQELRRRLRVQYLRRLREDSRR